MKFRDFKIGQKIITGFALVAGIALIIGVVGFVGMNNVGNSFNAVSAVRLPSIQYLGEMKANLEKVQKGYIELLDTELDRMKREEVLMELRAAREKYIEAQKAYAPLEQSENEAIVYDQLQDLIVEWRNVNVMKVDKMHEDLLELDILDPMELRMNLEMFMKDHYALEVKVSNAIDNQMTFEGGESHQKCNFGKWVSGFSTNNATLNSNFRSMRKSHQSFHQAVHQVKNFVNQGALDKASSVYYTEMIPAADEVFSYFDLLNQEAKAAQDLFGEMSTTIMGESSEKHALVMDSIDELVKINAAIAKKEKENGDNTYSASLLLILLSIIIGIGLAVILSIVITRTITRGINKGVTFA
ncbi:MCP four helix bundle domain-containing protein, partial [Marinilabilia sp.]